MKSVVLHSAAAAELAADSDYYESRRPGLGDAFESEIEAALERIARRPKSFGVYKGRFRKCVLTGRFKYVIFFVEYDDRVWVPVIMDGRQQPDYWADRQPE
ncbi:MAG: type II toxin-antitoxin system RelE/ParE family toxin [Fimbriiglobus sp.]